jgi:hypothetical protein
VRLSHRIVTPAGPDVVWAALEDPARWPEHEVLLHHVECVSGPVREGQHLVVVMRGVHARVPVDVRAVDPRRRLGITVHATPGLREEVDHLLTPRARGGTEVRLQVALEGPFALFWFVPTWVARGLSLRLLGWRSSLAVVRSASAAVAGSDVA